MDTTSTLVLIGMLIPLGLLIWFAMVSDAKHKAKERQEPEGIEKGVEPRVTTEELLEEMVILQEKQLYWTRLLGIMIAVSFFGTIITQCVAKH